MVPNNINLFSYQHSQSRLLKAKANRLDLKIPPKRFELAASER